jgi:dihydroorotate dehydrogenase
MYKNGEGYAWCALSGAGAYLAGTTTYSTRQGNERNNTRLPFAPYPSSHAASNWLGLPNIGHAAVAKILASIPRIYKCPIGVSAAFDPSASSESAFAGLIEGLELYSKAGVDFIELNESCPNTAGHSSALQFSLEPLLLRLDETARRFLRKRSRNLPVIVKFSTDTDPDIVPFLLDALITMGYDGVNFGNTSTNYSYCKSLVVKSEHPTFDYFTKTFGGGVSGKPLADSSLSLVRTAASALTAKPPRREFHVIRVGGVETASDVVESLENGASLTEWYAGYFENYSKYGANVYGKLYDELSKFPLPKAFNFASSSPQEA